MKINLSGYYGMGNYGDELFALVTYRALLKKNSSNNVGIISPKNKNHPNVNYLLNNIPENIYNKSNIVGSVVRALMNLFALIFTDHLVFSGGSTISSPGLLRRLQIKMLKNKKISCIGVSIDEIDNDLYKKWLIEFVNSSDFFSVRDFRSYNYLCSLGVGDKVILSADIAGSLPFYYPDLNLNNSSESKILGVSLCSKSKNIESLISAIIKISQQEKYNVKIFCLNEHSKYGDKQISEYAKNKIIESGTKCTIEYNCKNVLGVWKGISECDFFVSVRLHGAITAYMTGVPFYMDCYHIKCFDFLKSIGYEYSSKLIKNKHEIFYEFITIVRREIEPEVSVESYMNQSLLNFKLF